MTSPASTYHSLTGSLWLFQRFFYSHPSDSSLLFVCLLIDPPASCDQSGRCEHQIVAYTGPPFLSRGHPLTANFLSWIKLDRLTITVAFVVLASRTTAHTLCLSCLSQVYFA